MTGANIMNISPPKSIIRLLLIICMCSAIGLPPVTASAHQTPDEDVTAGSGIYVEGRLPDGSLLRAKRSGMTASGAAVACISCHRASGLGQVEGDYPVPPISGRALFGTSRGVVTNMDRVRGKTLNVSHHPYTQDEFLRMVTEGEAPGGRTLSDMMPRYTLTPAEAQSLSAYLATLSAQWSPGVSREALELATIITPEVAPSRRKAFLDTLKLAVRRKNSNTMPGRRHMVSAAEFSMKTERRWNLSVWELKGHQDSWPAQLIEFQKRQPVFAVLSGISDADWNPVHEFCEKQRIACWFPSLSSAPNPGTGRYSLYFHRGVSLEADLIAEHLARLPPAMRPRRVVQLISAEHQAAGAGAVALAKRLHDTAITVEERFYEGGDYGAVADTLHDDDVLILWLDATSLDRAFGEMKPRNRVYISSIVSRIDLSIIPVQWRAMVRVTFPYETPSQRTSNIAYFHYWMRQANIPVIDEVMQNEVYFAATYLSDVVAEMLENLHTDYLIERAENMLSRRESRKTEDESRDAQTLRRFAKLHPLSGTAGAAPDSPAAHHSRQGTTVYPALSLGPGQRHASRGGYIITSDSTGDMHPTEWIVPE